MKHALLICVLIGSLAPARGQWELDFAGKDFHSMRSTLEQHFDSLAASGDSSAFHEGGPYSRFKRWSEFWSLRLDEHTDFEDYFEAEALAQAGMQSRAAGNTDPWYEIGPKDKPSLGVSSIGQGSQPGIGPIHFLSFSDVDSDKMLCGSNIGGIWYADNGGLQWNNGGSDGGEWKRTGCRYAQFKVGDASTWYAANSGYFFYSGAILRGTNYGGDWDVIADQADFPAGGVWTKVNKLVTDHENPDVLYAATEHRLWRTENVNASDPVWNEVIIPTPPGVTGHPTYGTGSGYYFHDGRYIYDLEVDPSNSDNLYATVRYDGGLSDTEKVQFWRLMRSQDGGATWVEMLNQSPQPFYDVPFTTWIAGVATPGIEHRNANFMTIEVTNANADWLYVFYDRNVVGNEYVDELYKISNAANGTWDPPLKTDIHMMYGGGNGFGVDQVNGEDIYIDHNYGSNSSDIGRYLTLVGGAWTDYVANTTNELQYHVDVEDFVGDPESEGVVWMVNHGGIHRSADGGATWEWRGTGLAVAEVYRMANSYSEPDRLITGLFHDASVLTEGAYGPEWEPEWRQLGGGDGQQPFIDQDEGNWVYWSSQAFSWRKSSNYGASPRSFSPAWYCKPWETAGAMDNGMPNAIYWPGWPNVTCNTINYPMEIKRSFDRGVTWVVVSDFLALMGPGKKGVWRIYSSPFDAEDLLVHFPDGHRVFRTRMARGDAQTAQASWQEIYVPRTDRFISDIDFDPKNPDVLYFAYSSEVMEDPVTDGSGMLFKVTYDDPMDPMNASSADMSAPGGGAAALPNTGVGSEAVVLERGSNGGIYIGTDLGVFYTNNEFLGNGTGWQLLGANLPHVSCRGLEISYKANRLRAGMEGRGVWEHDLWCPDETDQVETGTYGADAFIEAINNIISDAVTPIGTWVDYRAGNEVHLEDGFHAMAGSEFHAFIHPCDRSGNSFKSMLADDVGNAWEDDENGTTAPSELVVHPNPSHGVFSIALPTDAAMPVEVTLWNSIGRRVPIQLSGTSRSMMVSLTGQVAVGVYLLHVRFQDGSLRHAKLSIVP